MRVLWFTNNSCNCSFAGKIRKGRSGGWMTALQDEFERLEDVDLGICFMADGLPPKIVEGKTIYFPVPIPQKSFGDKCKGFLRFHDIHIEEPSWAYYVENFKNVIEQFNPDIIHVFGSELYMGLAVFATDRPLVLHIQGILHSCYNALYAPGISVSSMVFHRFRPIHMLKAYFDDLWWRRNCYREYKVLSKVQHFIGRTEWDKRLSYVFNPKSTYHFGEEIMRLPFYSPQQRILPSVLTINTVISQPMYKGYDLVLKTANILKNYLHLDFIWNVYGRVSAPFIERHLSLYHKDLNVELKGLASAEEIRDSHAKATVYVHPSYIENGCNAIIEAQMCGCSVVANYVGGLTDTIKHGETGFLVPANDPYQTAYLIDYLFTHQDENLTMGKRAAADAFRRHDKEKILADLLSTYKSIIQDA